MFLMFLERYTFRPYLLVIIKLYKNTIWDISMYMSEYDLFDSRNT
jgi:hypothetical protein